MKRHADTEEECKEVAELHGEIWDFIASYGGHGLIKTVFLLDKRIYAYLRVHSQLAMDIAAVFRLNARYSNSTWFICSGCDKLHVLKMPHYMRMLTGFFCDDCARRCSCGERYIRCMRIQHRECDGYPAPFSPMASTEEVISYDVAVVDGDDDDDDYYNYDYGEEGHE